MASETVVALFYVVKDDKNNVVSLYNPRNNSHRLVTRKWKLKNLKDQLNVVLDKFFVPEWTVVDKPNPISEKPNLIMLEANEIEGDIILNVTVRGGEITDSEVTVKDLKLNYNLYVDGARINGSRVMLEGAQLIKINPL